MTILKSWKTKSIAFLIITMLCFASCNTEGEGEKISDYYVEFENPSAEYRSAPLWVWNTDVTKGDIDRMLEELKEQGFGGAFVHPRPGMITSYLSDEWFELYRYSYEKAKELGMDIWIYDENSYPSGFAGGHVPAEMPESYNQGQGLRPSKVNKLPNDLAPYFLCYKKEGESYKDITKEAKEYKGVDGEYYLFEKTYYGANAWHAGYSYVDLLYPGVTEKFMEVTMSGYEKEFGKELGTGIKGIFTDEPNIESSGGIRWTPDLFAEFEKQWGYDLQAALPLLVEESGNWRQVRHNYIETLLQMFIDRWAKPWYNYCEDKNLQWTGHYWEHGWPNLAHGGDNMAMYAWHQLPAIDMLFNQYNDVSPQAQFGNIRAVKELRSVANQMGNERTLSETYGGGGWDETFQDFKRLGDWEYVLGVNFMNQHLSHMTISGARKYDYPPVFTSHSPWWDNYKSQNDYFARLSLLLSKGEQMNDILILEPTSSLWMYYSFVASNKLLQETGDVFQAFVTRLEKSQVEYDLGSENIIKDQGAIKEGQFIINKRGYKKVVLPPLMNNINAPTFKLLKEFVEAGGELICFSTPQYIDGKESKSELDALFRNKAENIKIYAQLSDDIIKKDMHNSSIQFSDVMYKNLFHQRRTFADGELVFIVNSSLEESYSGTVTIKGKSLQMMDAMDGKRYAYTHTASEGKVSAKFDIPPAGSLLLFSSKSNVGKLPKKLDSSKKVLVKSDQDVTVKRMQDNAILIDYCDLIINDKTQKDVFIRYASDILFKEMGLEKGNPWNAAVQYKTAIVDKDTFKTGNIKVHYHFTVEDKMDMSKFRLVAEQPNIWKVRVNNNEVAANKGEYWLDARFGVYDAGKYMKLGKNTVELYVNPMSIFAEVEPVYILGDFAVAPTNDGWKLISPKDKFALGSWKDQGQPFYSWDMSYAKEYQMDDAKDSYIVKLNKWEGTVSEVYVNGQKAGVIAYAPYELDVSPYLTKDKNKVEIRVIGSLRNLLGPHLTPAVGITGPWHWNNIKGKKSGSDYKMFDYGLMQDFDLFKVTN